MIRLNEKQIAAIVILAQPKRAGLTYEQIADQVGVNRRTLQEWRKEPIFSEEVKKQIVRNTITDLPEIMASVPRHIINDGNATLFRTFLQMHGLLTDRVEVAHQAQASNTDVIKAEIERLRSGTKASA